MTTNIKFSISTPNANEFWAGISSIEPDYIVFDAGIYEKSVYSIGIVTDYNNTVQLFNAGVSSIDPDYIVFEAGIYEKSVYSIGIVTDYHNIAQLFSVPELITAD